MTILILSARIGFDRYTLLSVIALTRLGTNRSPDLPQARSALYRFGHDTGVPEEPKD